MEGHIGVAALLLRAGASVNATDTEGKSALHVACFNGRTSCAQLVGPGGVGGVGGVGVVVVDGIGGE